MDRHRFVGAPHHWQYLRCNGFTTLRTLVSIVRFWRIARNSSGRGLAAATYPRTGRSRRGYASASLSVLGDRDGHRREGFSEQDWHTMWPTNDADGAATREIAGTSSLNLRRRCIERQGRCKSHHRSGVAACWTSFSEDLPCPKIEKKDRTPRPEMKDVQICPLGM